MLQIDPNPIVEFELTTVVTLGDIECIGRKTHDVLIGCYSMGRKVCVPWLTVDG